VERFLWGVATSSYQIEGAALGRGSSNWDTFAERPGAIYQGHHAKRAVDHVNRLEEDLDLLKTLGVTAYRFSFSWARVQPEGRGLHHPPGLGFYDRLVDGLIARGIEPVATLFHWDLPQALEREGGFLNSEMPRWFGEYTELLARHFGSRIRRWLTLNEPHAFIEGGLRQGRHAPGHCLPMSAVLRAAHHALLAHGRAVEALRAHAASCWVSAAPVLIAAIPATSSADDLDAARRMTFRIEDSLRCSGFWLDPLYSGHYSDEVFQKFSREMPKFPSTDLDQIAQRLDAVGVNLYDAPVVRQGDNGEPEVVPWPPGAPRTAFNWPVTPLAHYYGPKFCFERYGLPIVITENGLSTRDWVALDGQVHDPDRIDFLECHVQELLRARGDGIPIDGYFHWSLFDNFEWNHGYRERFGLVYVDYETLKRTPKDSYFHYRSLIERYRSTGVG
jgi:beta-glucosidase